MNLVKSAFPAFKSDWTWGPCPFLKVGFWENAFIYLTSPIKLHFFSEFSLDDNIYHQSATETKGSRLKRLKVYLYRRWLAKTTYLMTALRFQAFKMTRKLMKKWETDFEVVNKENFNVKTTIIMVMTLLLLIQSKNETVIKFTIYFTIIYFDVNRKLKKSDIHDSR